MAQGTNWNLMERPRVRHASTKAITRGLEPRHLVQPLSRITYVGFFRISTVENEESKALSCVVLLLSMIRNDHWSIAQPSESSVLSVSISTFSFSSHQVLSLLLLRLPSTSLV